MEDEHSKIRIIASEEEHKQITTNADELLKNTKVEKEPQFEKRKSVEIRIDDEERLFPMKSLNKEEIEHLNSKGFIKYEGRRITSNVFEEFMIKPRFNESSAHFFLTYDIADYLKKFTDKVWLYETVKPDVVFEIKGKTYAVEVETGKVLKSKVKSIIEKSKRLKTQYPDKWFFVVTDNNLRTAYSKHGLTFDKRSVKGRLNRIIRNRPKVVS